MTRTVAILIFLASIILLVAVLLMPAVADGQPNVTIVEKNITPLGACEIRMDSCEIARDGFAVDVMDLGKMVRELRAENAALQGKLTAVYAGAKKPIKPVAKPKSCPILKGNQKCKSGRWQSPKHNCKCGRWNS